MLTLSRRSLRRALPWPLAVAAWLAASVSSGFAVTQIAMFAGPGVVLAVAASWASHAGFPYRWNWRGTGLGGTEPVTWRRRLRRAGFAPEALSQGIGPRWNPQVFSARLSPRMAAGLTPGL